MLKIGLIINPCSGLGGPMGLKGSDGEAAARALAMGAKPQAEARAREALSPLLPLGEELHFLTFGGPMGEDCLKAMGFSYSLVGRPAGQSTAADTIRAARAIGEAGASLLLFAGGDGTARDIVEATGTKLPVVGIPAGVKIHSGVYASTPRRAGEAALAFVRDPQAGAVEREVMDIDEALFREGRVAARLYGYLPVPASAGDCIQCTKAEGSGGGEADALSGMAAYVVDNMEAGVLYLIGPGSTTRAVMEDMGLPCTLLGVDAVKDGRLVGSDLNEPAIWELVQGEARVKIVLTIIGGQGNLLGRGNQQFSPRVLRRVGKENLIVVSTRDKLTGLGRRPLVSDSGDPLLDQELRGYVDVIVDYDQSVFYRLSD